MWHEGDLYRQQRGLMSQVPGVTDLAVSGKSATGQGQEQQQQHANGYGGGMYGVKPQLYSRQPRTGTAGTCRHARQWLSSRGA